MLPHAVRAGEGPEGGSTEPNGKLSYVAEVHTSLLALGLLMPAGFTDCRLL